MLKGPLALRTISEAATQLGVQQHVLRFWETKFTFVRPTKLAGGRRFYRPQDLALLEGVQTLLHVKGYTIRGVQKLYKEQGQKAILSASLAEPPSAESVSELPEIVNEPVQLSLMGNDVDVAQKLSHETRQKLLDIAQKLEQARVRLGASLERSDATRKL